MGDNRPVRDRQRGPEDRSDIMTALAIIDRILGIARVVRRAIDEHAGEELRNWGSFAAENPRGAAMAMERVAAELQAWHDGLAPRRKILRRRLSARINAYRDHARDLLRYADGLPCVQNPVRRPWV